MAEGNIPLIVHAITDFRSAKAVVKVLKHTQKGRTRIPTPDKIVEIICDTMISSAIKGNGYNPKTDSYNAIGGPIVDGIMFVCASNERKWWMKS